MEGGREKEGGGGHVLVPCKPRSDLDSNSAHRMKVMANGEWPNPKLPYQEGQNTIHEDMIHPLVMGFELKGIQKNTLIFFHYTLITAQLNLKHLGTHVSACPKESHSANVSPSRYEQHDDRLDVNLTGLFHSDPNALITMYAVVTRRRL